MRKMLLALLMGLAAGVAGAEDVKFLEYVEVPYGAYFDTGVVPTDHETEITFSCDYLNGIPCQFGSSSPCYDTAAKLGWMDENAVDLLGNARIFSTGPDMGCFESRSGGLLLRVK